MDKTVWGHLEHRENVMDIFQYFLTFYKNDVDKIIRFIANDNNPQTYTIKKSMELWYT